MVKSHFSNFTLSRGLIVVGLILFEKFVVEDGENFCIRMMKGGAFDWPKLETGNFSWPEKDKNVVVKWTRQILRKGPQTYHQLAWNKMARNLNRKFREFKTQMVQP